MNTPQIKDVLIDVNPWWKGSFSISFKERQVYKELQKYMPLKHIIAFTGLRRVGKTTLMYKIIEDSLRGGFDPKNILYFTFDEFKGAELRSVMKDYESLMEKDLRKGQYLILLDEIQKIGDWEGQLKAVYDLFGKNIKIIISGSESLFIRKKSRDTLAGRMFEFKVELLTFSEFLRFKGAELKPEGLYGKELLRLFEEFTITCGFPELVGVADKDIITKYIRESIIDKVIYRDIPGIFKIKDPSVLESLLNIIMDEPGQIIELASLAGDMNLSRQTLSAYVSYLEQSFLIKKLYNFSRNRRKIERKLKKYYPAAVSPTLLFKEDTLSKSRVFEAVIVSQLKAEFFWRDKYKNEVDIVIGSDTPVEVKYGKVDFSGVLAFMKKFGVKKDI